MLLPIVKIGNPVLRKNCEAVSALKAGSSELERFIQDMIETMHHAEGVGLAANQVGRNSRVIVLESKANSRYPEAPSFPLQTFINPKIRKYSKSVLRDWEGCLSIPGYRGLVPRAEEIEFEAQRPDGEKVMFRASGFYARVLQHEVDHINGLFYMDRMKDLSEWYHLDEFEAKVLI